MQRKQNRRTEGKSTLANSSKKGRQEIRIQVNMHLPPNELIKSNLHGNVLGFSSFDLPVKPVVEVVSRGSMVEETEGRKSDEASHIEWSSTNENLQSLDYSKKVSGKTCSGQPPSCHCRNVPAPKSHREPNLQEK